MRILLTANASYVPPRGGATRSNIVWLDLLARAGHECRIVCSELARDPAGKLEQLQSEGIRAEVEAGSSDDVEIVRQGAILVYAAAAPQPPILRAGDGHPALVDPPKQLLGTVRLLAERLGNEFQERVVRQ